MIRHPERINESAYSPYDTENEQADQKPFKKIDPLLGFLELTDRTTIAFDDILSIE